MGEILKPPVADDVATLTAIIGKATAAAKPANPDAATILWKEAGVDYQGPLLPAVAAALQPILRRLRGEFHTSDYAFVFGASTADPASLSGSAATTLATAMTANDTAITSMLADIAAWAPSASRMATLVFDGGSIVFGAAFRIPRHTNVATMGCDLTYSGATFAAAPITVGQSTDATTGAGAGNFDLPYLRCSRAPSHRWSPRNISVDAFAGYRFELVGATGTVRGVSGFGLGVQFLSAGSMFCSRNRFHVASAIDNIVDVDIRGAVSGQATARDNVVTVGWSAITANYLACSKSSVRFSVEPAGNTEIRGNHVTLSCDLRGAPPQIASGDTIVADQQAMNNGRAYLALGAGTQGATLPTHNNGSDTAAGGITWRDLGVTRRVPVEFAGAGTANSVDIIDWDNGYGGPVIVRGGGGPLASGAGSVVTVRMQRVASTVPAGVAVDVGMDVECLLNASTTIGTGAANIEVVLQGRPRSGHQMPPLITSIIGSATGLTASGGYCWTNSTDTGRVRQVSTNQVAVLCYDGVELRAADTGSDSNDALGVMVPFAPGSGAFVGSINSAIGVTYNAPRARVKAYDRQGVAIAAGGASPIYIELVHGSDSITTNGNLYSESGETYCSRAVLRGATNTHAVFYGFSLGRASAIHIDRRRTGVMADVYWRRSLPQAVDTTVSPHSPAANATPTLGYFPGGARVHDITGATAGWDVGPGWLVPTAATAGAATPSHEWSAGMTLLPNQIVTAGGNCYMAIVNSATTAGSTGAPTGTNPASNVSDGSVQYRYVGPLAAVVAV